MQRIQRLLNQNHFMLHLADRLSIMVSLHKVGTQKLKEKLVADCEIFTLARRGRLNDSRRYRVFCTKRR
jgi:hypothetical protein